MWPCTAIASSSEWQGKHLDFVRDLAVMRTGLGTTTRSLHARVTLTVDLQQVHAQCVVRSSPRVIYPVEK
jgi:hypothetical protein